jgi:hypothetical protein
MHYLISHVILGKKSPHLLKLPHLVKKGFENEIRLSHDCMILSPQNFGLTIQIKIFPRILLGLIVGVMTLIFSCLPTFTSLSISCSYCHMGLAM